MNWRLSLSAVFISGLLFDVVSYAAVDSLVQIRNVGTVRAIGVEVYADETLEQVLHEVSWGTLNPGEVKSVNTYIKNSGNDAQKLILWTESWEPAVSQDWICLSWDYNNNWIQAESSISVTFTLSVDPNIAGIDSFCFDIWIKEVT